MFRVLGVHEERHLMRPEGPFNLQPIDEFWAGPALGRTQHDHWPARPDGDYLSFEHFPECA